MELLDYPIKLANSGHKVYLHAFGDIHRAALGCDSKQLRSDIADFGDAAEADNGETHLWIGMGDWLNCIGIKDKRHDGAAIAPEFREHIGDSLMSVEEDTLVSEFEPIKQYGIGLCSGNHELKAAKHTEVNHARNLARRLDVPYLGYSAVIRFRLRWGAKTNSVITHIHHGRGAGRTRGGKVNTLYSMRDVVDADVHIVGHDHDMLDFPAARLSVTRTGELRLRQDEVLFVNSGTYLKSTPVESAQAQEPGRFNNGHKVKTDYAEVCGYNPCIIGHGGFSMRFKGTGTGKDRRWGVRLKRVDYRR